jgi:sugar fermentation stimulation protein A
MDLSTAHMGEPGLRYGGKLQEGVLKDRPNRFLGRVKIGRRTKECFIPNPGRMEELLYPGATVYVKEGADTERRTKLDIVLVKKDRNLVCIDTRMPNKLVEEAIGAKAIRGLGSYKVERTEYSYLNSRFDFLLKGRKGEMLLEAKSCTLVEGELALFPDSPTERGARHMKTLADAVRRGMSATVLFVIQRSDAKRFSPYDRMDPEFGLSLRVAMAKGVQVMAYKCKVTRTSAKITEKVPVKL